MSTTYAFLDRDGALILEPQDTFQIGSLEVLQILDGVITGLQFLRDQNYKFIMVSNQDGLGTQLFPLEEFQVPQNRMLEIFKENGIEFEKIFICPHFSEENCNCRKPKTGLVDEWLKTANIDFQKSFMYGDRVTDSEFAKNIRIQFIKAETNGAFRTRQIRQFVCNS